MITVTGLKDAMESWLPDPVVVADLKNAIYSGGQGDIHLESGTTTIPPDCRYDVVSKAFILEERYGIGFGNCFRVVVAIGGVEGVDNGIIRARYCFSTLWYTTEPKLITTDFSRDMP